MVKAPEILRALCALRMTSVIVILRSAAVLTERSDRRKNLGRLLAKGAASHAYFLSMRVTRPFSLR